MAAKSYRIPTTGQALVENDAGGGSGTGFGWTVAKVAAGNSSEYSTGTKLASTSFTSQTTTPKPVSPLGSATWFRTPALVGTFATGTWTLLYTVYASTVSSQQGRARVRIWKSANSDGSSATELTASTLVGSTYTLTLLAGVASGGGSTATWTPGSTVVLSNEYLFFSWAWEIMVASGSNSGDVMVSGGSAASNWSVITTPNFVAKSLLPVSMARQSQRQQRGWHGW